MSVKKDEHLPEIRVEFRHVIPIITIHRYFAGIDDLLAFFKQVNDNNNHPLLASVSEVGAARFGNLTWLVQFEPDRNWLDFMRERGKCGLCDADISTDPATLPAKNTIYQRGKLCCDHCGRVLIDEYREASLSEIFDSLANGIDTIDARVMGIGERKET